MRNSWILILATCVTGCATHRPVAISSAPATPKPVVRAASTTHLVETRYDVRAYRDAEDPNVRHDAHAVYRTTRVPAQLTSLDTTPRNAAAPISHAPLPANAELSAELAAQRQITGELREIQSRMNAIQQQAQSQYGTLVNQTADTLKLRQQLEGERARVRELEAKLRDHAPAPAGTEGIVATKAAPETKW